MSDGFTAARLACSASAPAAAKGGKKGKGKGKGKKAKAAGGKARSQVVSAAEQAAANNAAFLSRACKTAVHEMGHMCGIGGL